MKKNIKLFQISINVCALILIITFAWKGVDAKMDVIDEGKKLIEEFEFNGAIELFSKELDCNEDDYLLQYYLGEAIRQRLFFSRYKELSSDEKNELVIKSRLAFQSSLKINPEMVDAYIGLARLYFYDREYENALSYYKIAISKQPSNKELFNEIGKTYLKIGKTDLAKRYFSMFTENKSSFINDGTIFITHFSDKMHPSDKNYEINGNIKWVVVDALIFNARIPEIRFGEKIINETFIASISTFKSRSKSMNVDFSKINKHATIEYCNANALHEYGMKIKDYDIFLGK